jgi:hypothetical protein
MVTCAKPSGQHYGSLRILMVPTEANPKRSSGPCGCAPERTGLFGWLPLLGHEEALPLSDLGWQVGSDFPLDNSVPANVVPLSMNGRKFQFIASATPWRYAQDDGSSEWMQFGADGILLFFEPVERIVLQTFEWG